MTCLRAISMVLLAGGLWAQSVAPVYRVQFETSAGDFVVEVQPDWSPKGAERFRELVENGFFDDVRFFRVVKGFVAQFGIHGNPRVSSMWRPLRLPDEKPKASNLRGTLAYAKSGPNTRTTQVFINLADNKRLDSEGFAPFAKVVEGLETVDAIYSGYGEDPDQSRIESRGNSYLQTYFPKLDYIKRATVIK